MLPTLAGVAKAAVRLQQAAAVYCGDHQSTVQPWLGTQMRRHPVVVVMSRLQLVDASFADAGEVAQCDGDRVHGDRQWHAMKVAAQLGLIVKDQRVVGDCTEFPKDDTSSRSDGVEYRAQAPGRRRQ